MRKSWLSVLLFMSVACPAAHAQQYYSHPYNPYTYYGYPQPQRYSYPYPYGANYRPSPPPGYFYPTPGNTYGPYAAPAVEPASRYGNNVPPARPTDYPAESPRVRKAQIEVPMLPSPPVPDPNRGYATSLWSKFNESGIASAPCATGACGHDPYGAACGPTPCKIPRDKEVMWMTANYVAAYLRPMRLAAPLITTGSLNDEFTGAIGQPSTAILFGNDAVDFNLASGFNVSMGLFLDRQGHFSLDIGAFAIFAGRQSFTFGSDATGNPVITRPVFATDFNVNAAFLIAGPDVASGTTKLDFTSNLQGGEFGARYHGRCGKCFRYDFLLGARYTRLAERMNIEDNVNFINNNVIPFDGVDYTTVIRNDNFATTNQFVGAQFGGSMGWRHSWWSVDGFAKIGLGATTQQVSIDGSTTFANENTSTTQAGGILALPSNMGNYSRSVFGILPEMGVNVGINITDHVRLQIGGSTLMWNRVVRPGMQFSDTVNSSLAPSAKNFGNPIGPMAPLFCFRDEAFWMYSLNLGLNIHY